MRTTPPRAQAAHTFSSGTHQVQLTAWNTAGGDFRANLETDADVTARLSPEQLADCFSTDLHQANLDVIWQRLGI